MTEFVHIMAGWGLIGAACSAGMFLREVFWPRSYAAVRVRRGR